MVFFGVYQSGYSLFRFFNVWCPNLEPERLVANSWENSLSQAYLWDKLLKVKFVLSSWQKFKYDMSSSHLKACEEELEFFLMVPFLLQPLSFLFSSRKTRSLFGA